MLENERTNLETADEFDEFDEISAETVDEKEESDNLVAVSTNNSENQPAQYSATTEPLDTLGVITKAAVQKIADDCLNNGKNIKEGVIDTLSVATTIEAVSPENEENKKFRDDLKKTKQSEIKSNFKADKYASDAKKAEAKRQKAEAFYKAFRPILEFDFSNITERERENKKNYNDRSYGIAMMTLMLVIFTPFYILLSLLLMVCKSVNEVCKYVATFSKTAMKTCLASFIILVVLLVLYIIIRWVEQRFGIPIINQQAAELALSIIK